MCKFNFSLAAFHYVDPPIAEMSRERETNSGKNLIHWTAVVSVAIFIYSFKTLSVT